MKAIFSLILTALFTLGLTAQNATAVVLHSSGQVQYFATANATPKKVYPGLELQVTGKIRCLKGGTAKLLYNGKSFPVSGGRMQDISEVVKASTGGTQIGFTGRFFNFLTESMQESESTEKLQKHHRRYMGKNSASIKGFSTKNFDIVTPLVTMGKLPAARVTFKWRSVAGAGPYTFQLMTGSGDLVAELLARDTFVTLDLDELAMDIQAEYQWQVTRNDGKSSSAVIPFELTKNTTEKAETDLDKQADDKTLTPMEKKLMLAYFLEQERYWYQANAVYEQLLSSAQPDDVLVRKLYAAFMARMNMLPEGQKMIENIDPK